MTIPTVSRVAPDAVIASTLMEAMAICAQTERGHGRGTLAARFEQLKAVGARAPLAVVVALSESSLRRATSLQSELQEADHRAQTMTGSMSADMLRGGARWTRLGLFSTPLASADFRSEWLAAAIAECVAVVFVVGAEDEALAGQGRDILRDLANVVPALQPVIVPAEGARKPLRPWWEDASLTRVPIRLPPIAIAQAAGAPLLAATATQPAAKAGATLALLRALQSGIESLGTALTRESARQRALKAREDRALRAAETRQATGAERATYDRVRQRLDDDLLRIERKIEDQNRRALLPGGPVNQAVNEMLPLLTPHELERTESHSEIRVTVRSDFAARLLDAVKKEIRNQFKEDMQQLKSGAEACREALAAGLAQATGTRPVLAPVHVDENEIWRSLREALSLELGYHGTLPNRGFWKRLAEGKQLMFTMLSILSLGGMVFGFTRTEIGPLIAIGLPVVFFIGIGLTFMNWKQEDAARLDKELERIREQLGTEAKRRVGEIQREKMLRLKESIETIRKELVRRMDGALKEHQAVSAERATRGRNEGRDRQRALDQRLRELQALAPQLARLRQSCMDAQRDAQDAARALLKPGAVA